LSFGGMNPPTLYANTEEYNGTGWAAGGALPSTVFDHAGDGVQTSAFSAGGQQTDPGSSTTASAEYNGTSWTAGGSISTARKKLMGLGVSNTAGLIFGGQIDTGPAQTATEEYDGSSWTAGGSLNTAMDIVADPTNLIGAGLLTKGYKGAKAVKGLANKADDLVYSLAAKGDEAASAASKLPESPGIFGRFNPKTRDYGMFQLNEDNLKGIFGDTKDFVNDTYKKGPKKGKKISAEEAKRRGKEANETFKNSFSIYYGKGIENITNITAEELKELFVKDRSEFLELIKNNHDVNLGIAISGSILPNLQK